MSPTIKPKPKIGDLIVVQIKLHARVISLAVRDRLVCRRVNGFRLGWPSQRQHSNPPRTGGKSVHIELVMS